MSSAMIYMDSHATTRCDPRVVEAMIPYFVDQYGNASSRNHAFGWAADEAVQENRAAVASLIGADPREIVFTSGATESNNLAIKGTAALYRDRRRHLITVATEHHAVLDPCRKLQRDGFELTILGVDSQGMIRPEQVEEAIRPDTLLVSVMLANNEIGVIQPIAEIGALCKRREVLFHTDATQAVAKIPVDVHALAVDLLSLSAHKMHGPKGVGALYVRRRDPCVRLEPLFDGGGHERGMRSGTLAVPLIVGLGKTCQLAAAEGDVTRAKIRELRDLLEAELLARIPYALVNGNRQHRLPGNLNMSFPGVNGEALLMSLKTVAVSSGSACTSASVEPSYVLRALGLPDDLAQASLRFGLSRYNTEGEVRLVVPAVAQAVERLRALNPLGTAAV